MLFVSVLSSWTDCQRWYFVVCTASLPLLFTFFSLQTPFPQTMTWSLVSYNNPLVWNQHWTSHIFTFHHCHPLLNLFTIFDTCFTLFPSSVFPHALRGRWCYIDVYAFRREVTVTSLKLRRGRTAGPDESNWPWFNQVSWYL